MREAQVGDVVGPIKIVDPRSENIWSIARVLGKTSGGLGDFSNFRDLIEERLRSQGLTETVIDELRSRAYVDIRLGDR